MSELAEQLIAEAKKNKSTHLQLGRCGLTELPESLLALQHLESLDLRNVQFDSVKKKWQPVENSGPDNQIQSIHGMSRLHKLEQVWLGGGLFGYRHDKILLEDISELAELPLKSIDISFSNVRDLQPLSALSALQSLNCSYNTEISDLQPLSALSALQSLNCNDTNVSDLQPLSSLSALQSLNCNDTNVSDLQALSSLSALQSLNCNDTNVSDLQALSSLSALQSLDCSDTEVSDLRPLSALSALQSLYCGGTKVSDLQPLSALSALQSLYCGSTKVSDLQPLSALSALQSLYCSDTTVSDLQPLSSLSALHSLDCTVTMVRDLQPLSALSALQSLYCSHTQVSDLQPLSALSALQSLYCGNTKVSDLQPLSALSALQSLDCKGTKVSDLQPLTALSALQSLNCSFTYVSDLQTLSSLSALQSLNCSFTNVSDLQALSSLPALHSLYCSHTQVSDLQPLSALSALQSLDCSDTKVSDLSPLWNLIRQGMAISNEYFELGLRVDNCPLVTPPMSVTKKGREAVLRYFDAMDAEVNKTPAYINRRARLIVLGNSTAGKSHLVAYLTGDKRQRTDLKTNSNIISTHGMECVQWLARKPVAEQFKTEDVEISIIDFGGQEYYHDCHHLFFGDHTAYILLWESQTNCHKELETPICYTAGDTARVYLQHHPIDYWLGAIAHFVRQQSTQQFDLHSLFSAERHQSSTSDNSHKAESGDTLIKVNDCSMQEISRRCEKYLDEQGLDDECREARVKEVMQTIKAGIFDNAPAIIVQNKLDQDKRQGLNMEDIQQRFPFVVENIAVSARQGLGMDYLECSLLPEMINQLPIVGERYPGHYGKAIEQLLNIDTFDVSLNEIRQIYIQTKPVTLMYDEKMFLDFIALLVRQGRALYFADSPELNDRVFLKPYELLGRFYTILNRELEEKNGEFEVDDARQALTTCGFAATETGSIIDLMMHFHIIFPLPLANDRQVYIAPQYLHEHPHSGINFFKHMFAKPLLRFVYKGFVHSSVILHFYSEFGQKAQPVDNRTVPKSAKDFLLWRDGLFIKEGDETVLVEFDRTLHHINICPQGDLQISPLVKQIVQSIETISSGQSYQKEVSPDGDMFVDLTELENKAKNNIHWFEHNGLLVQLGKFSLFLNQSYPMKKLFISYSSKDILFTEELRSHLRVLQRNSLIDTWYDREILVGQEWDKKIKDELKQADIIVLLLSPDFINSDYIWDVELEHAINMHQQNKATVVPIVLRSCLWEDTPISKLQLANKAEVIDLASNRDEAWKKAVEGIRAAIKTSN